MEIVRGVHQIKIPMPQSSLEQINVYIIEGEEGNLLIDTGWNTPEAFDALKGGLRQIGFSFKDIKQIVVTHTHPDHYGAVGRLTQLSGAKLALHEAEIPLINSRYVNFDNLLKEMEEYLRKNGVPTRELPTLQKASLWVKELVVPVQPEIILKNGDKLTTGSFELEVLHTPGHSIGHICLYEAQRKLLFSGDHILSEITPHIGLHPQSGDNPLGDFIKSLKEIEELEVNFVFPGHGAAFSGLKQKIWDILYHHEQRERAVTKVIQDELKTAYQIANELPWKPEEGGINFKDLTPWDKRLAILETLAHLQFMISEDKAEKIIENDRVLFWAGD